eukprot:scaffold2429_cov214-Alexandrium_tamarense.AAC.5
MVYLARDSSRHRGRRVFAVQSRVTARRWVASRQVCSWSWCERVGERRGPGACVRSHLFREYVDAP